MIWGRDNGWINPLHQNVRGDFYRMCQAHLASHEFVAPAVDFSVVNQETSEEFPIHCSQVERGEALDQTIATILHDLKEPIRGFQIYTEQLMLDYGYLLDREGLTVLSNMEQLAQQSTALMTDLRSFLDVSLKEAQMETVKVDDIIDNILCRQEEELRVKRVTLHRAFALPTVHYDYHRLQMIFTHLISNGIKYNDSKNIEIEIGTASDCATDPRPLFYVRDNGIGIASHHHKRIFELFKRLHVQSMYGGGTGAGLAIVKRILERHGGRIWVESKPSRGSIFYFQL